MPADASAGEATVGRGQRWRGAVLVALFALTFLLGCFPMADFDVWWHLRTGQFILEHGAVPRFDIYTYTNAGRPWIDIYWLFQVTGYAFPPGVDSHPCRLAGNPMFLWTGLDHDRAGWRCHRGSGRRPGGPSSGHCAGPPRTECHPCSRRHWRRWRGPDCEHRIGLRETWRTGC